MKTDGKLKPLAPPLMNFGHRSTSLVALVIYANIIDSVRPRFLNTKDAAKERLIIFLRNSCEEFGQRGHFFQLTPGTRLEEVPIGTRSADW